MYEKKSLSYRKKTFSSHDMPLALVSMPLTGYFFFKLVTEIPPSVHPEYT